jgi:hypothetical protein
MSDEDAPMSMRQTVDRLLAANGKDMLLRRVVGTTNQVTYDCTVRAFAAGYLPHELSTDIIQGDTKITLSPTQIEAAQWPGGQAGPASRDDRVPRKLDRIIPLITLTDGSVIEGPERSVLAATPWYDGDELARIDLQTRGQQ